MKGENGEPRNRAIKTLLLASDRAAREAHCFEFETSVRSAGQTDQRSHLLTEKIHASTTMDAHAFINDSPLSLCPDAEWGCFGEICCGSV